MTTYENLKFLHFVGKKHRMHIILFIPFLQTRCAQTSAATAPEPARMKKFAVYRWVGTV